MAGRPPDSPWADPEFNPFEAPKAKVSLAPTMAGGGLWREGKLLVMRKDATLPDRCVRCNAPADGYKLKRNLSWHHPAIYIAILSPIIYIIIALIVRKTAKIQVGLCEVHRRRRRNTILFAWLGSFAGIGLIVFGLANSGPQASPDLGWLALAGLMLLVGALVWGTLAAPPVVPMRIDKQFVWLRKVCPEYLASLPEVPDTAPAPIA